MVFLIFFIIGIILLCCSGGALVSALLGLIAVPFGIVLFVLLILLGIGALVYIICK